MKKKNRLLMILVCLTVGFIWGHSLMPGEISGEESSRVFEFLRPFLEIFLGKGCVTETLVRKMAHFSEYALLSAELTVYFRQKKWKNVWLLSLTVCFIDETIQTFVPGRAGLIADMWIDMGGALTGFLIILGYLRWKSNVNG